MRSGIQAAGNFLLDQIKIIDHFPGEGMLVNIEEDFLSTGGGPFNVLLNLARLRVDIPLYATAVLGNDARAEYILNRLNEEGIDTSSITFTSRLPTSYTDVYTVKGTGQRTFFHNSGSNALLGQVQFENINSNARIFHLAYILILESLCKEDPDFKVAGAGVLSLLQKKGYKTSVDLISEESDRYQRIVIPCLPYTNYFIVNEFEASRTTGIPIRDKDRNINKANLIEAAELLFEYGVNDIVAIHFPEGGFAINKSGEKYFIPSFPVRESDIKGTNGAGDSFCAGMLYGIHEELPLKKCLQVASANARFNLTSPSCVEGIVTLEQLEKFIRDNPL
ncbi:MAG: carbohydrate kinase family protein [Ignavibacteriaceae bacterium]